MPTEEDMEMLKAAGWEVECESPFVVRHEDGSFATGQAAMMVTYILRENQPKICDECGEPATNTQGTHCQEHEHMVY